MTDERNPTYSLVLMNIKYIYDMAPMNIWSNVCRFHVTDEHTRAWVRGLGVDAWHHIYSLVNR
jgi:hypothetical protein